MSHVEMKADLNAVGLIETWLFVAIANNTLYGQNYNYIIFFYAKNHYDI